ncbi:MAG: hypothetical protein NTU80_10995 [Verrucomicrobia bacterium]|nr:hypothetical protein [Verrucomicrobiota bacterium]
MKKQLENFKSVSLPALVIPDVHEGIERAEQIVSKHSECTSVVFLGDYLDTHKSGDSVNLHLTLRWLLRSVRDPRRIHLMGNHDRAYLFCANSTYCSGWSEERQNVFLETVGEGLNELRARLLLAVQAGPWMLSHAGFSDLCRDATPAQLLQWAAHAHAALPRTGGHAPVHPLNGCGRVRGGDEDIGGLTWLDWSYEFKPLVGIHQIVGHTKSSGARYRNMNAKGLPIGGELLPKSPTGKLTARGLRSMNWCLDAELKFWAVIHEDRLEIHSDHGVTVCEAPSNDAVLREFPELVACGLKAEAGAEPPLYIPPAAVSPLLGVEDYKDEIAKITARSVADGVSLDGLEKRLAAETPPLVRAFLERVPAHRKHAEGAAPYAVAQALRALRRKGLITF